MRFRLETGGFPKIFEPSDLGRAMGGIACVFNKAHRIAICATLCSERTLVTSTIRGSSRG